jgi:hypothetical protein
MKPCSPLIIDRLQALSVAAEGASALSVSSNLVFSTPTKTTMSDVVTSMDKEAMTVDLFNSPGSQGPPWKGSGGRLNDGAKVVPKSKPQWFVDKHPVSIPTSLLIMEM